MEFFFTVYALITTSSQIENTISSMEVMLFWGFVCLLVYLLVYLLVSKITQKGGFWLNFQKMSAMEQKQVIRIRRELENCHVKTNKL